MAARDDYCRDEISKEMRDEQVGGRKGSVRHRIVYVSGYLQQDRRIPSHLYIFLSLQPRSLLRFISYLLLFGDCYLFRVWIRVFQVRSMSPPTTI